MAGEYKLNNALIALLERAQTLKEYAENDELDLEHGVNELNYISTRANELQSAMFDVNQALEKL